MTDRISIKQLEAMVARLNRLTDSPPKPYERDDDGRLRAQIGNWHISQAYGGVCVERMANEGGGVSCPIWMGHVPKREAYNRLSAFIAGLEFNQ